MVAENRSSTASRIRRRARWSRVFTVSGFSDSWLAVSSVVISSMSRRMKTSPKRIGQLVDGRFEDVADLLAAKLGVRARRR
jgi:hypothetical protein